MAFRRLNWFVAYETATVDSSPPAPATAYQNSPHTIANLACTDYIEKSHLAEALQYRPREVV